ncbi:MAG: GIY-YIG nuclease family protein [Bacteroidales bacterium]|nr:GIY-YIG nuclease family protein [Bacteroidales bacterium]
MYWVYILYSKSLNQFYKGQTHNLDERVIRHNIGSEKATKPGVPWILLWSTQKSDRSSSIILERKLKNLTRNRLISFMKKYAEGVVGPDEFLLLEKLSGY